MLVGGASLIKGGAAQLVLLLCEIEGESEAECLYFFQERWFNTVPRCNYGDLK